MICIDCLKLQQKHQLLSFFQHSIEGMYSLNYDALIDALTFYEEPIHFTIFHIECYEDPTELKEVLEIIHSVNPMESFTFV